MEVEHQSGAKPVNKRIKLQQFRAVPVQQRLVGWKTNCVPVKNISQGWTYETAQVFVNAPQLTCQGSCLDLNLI
jgi:hypothetical protein